MSKDSYGDGNVYRGQRSRDSAVKTITLAQPEEPLAWGYWQSIELAPLGVNVLIYIGKEIQLAYGRTSESGDFCGWYISDGGGSCYLDGEPTHWMPLPSPPQPEEPCDMKDMCIGCSPRNADGSCPDAPRKPLTDEQKMALCKQFPDHLTFNAIHAIEAAHGIKE